MIGGSAKVKVRRTPAGDFRADPAAWSNWADDVFTSRPLLRARARSVQHRIALARRHGLRRIDPHRATTLELAGLLHEVGHLLEPPTPSHDRSHRLAGAAFLETVGLHDVACLVAHLGVDPLDTISGLAEPVLSERWHDVDPDLLQILTYLDMTTDDDGCAIALPEKRSVLMAQFGPASAQVATFDRCHADALAGQRLLTFGHARRAS